MTTAPFRSNSNLGPDLTQVVKADQVWYAGAGRGAAGAGQIASPQLGDVSEGIDGRRYVWVQASGAIAVAASPGTQLALTYTAYDNVTAIAGAEGFYAPHTGYYTGTIATGDRFWAAQGAPL